MSKRRKLSELNAFTVCTSKADEEDIDDVPVGNILALPEEVLALIFREIPYEGNTWWNVFQTCKIFYQIGKMVFDPSIKYDAELNSLIFLETTKL